MGCQMRSHIPRQSSSKSSYLNSVREKQVMENRFKFTTESGSGKKIEGENLAVKKEYTGNLQHELLSDLGYLRK